MNDMFSAAAAAASATTTTTAVKSQSAQDEGNPYITPVQPLYYPYLTFLFNPYVSPI